MCRWPATAQSGNHACSAQLETPGNPDGKAWNVDGSLQTFAIHSATRLAQFPAVVLARGGGGTRGTSAKLRSAHHLSSTSHAQKVIVFAKFQTPSFPWRYPASAPSPQFLSTPRPAKCDSSVHQVTLSQHSRPSLPKGIPIGLLLTRLRLMAALRTHLLASSAMHLRLGYPSDPPGRLW